MKIRRNKKGFTIIELVIVIAVIAVLAAILIPTFASLTQKANVASDQSLKANLNTALRMQEAEDGEKNATMHDAVLDLDKQGYILDRLVTKSNLSLLWDEDDNQFVLDDGQYTGERYWKIVDNPTSATAEMGKDTHYSIYARQGADWNNAELAVTSGFDAGYNTTIQEIDYSNTAAGKEVIIRTNGGTLTVGTQDEPAAGKIIHYGTLDEAVVYTTKNSFHTHGKIACMDLKAGKAVAEDKGYVALVKAANDTEIQEVDTGVFYIPTNAVVADIDTTVAASLGYVSNGETTPSYVVDATTTKGQERAQALASNAYEIDNKFDLIAFRDAVNNGQDFSQIKVLLTNDIDMIGYEWIEPIGLDNTRFEGKFDGNNHRISNLSNNGIASTEVLVNNTTGNQGSIFGLFGFVKGEVEISNLTVSANAYTAADSNGWGAIVSAANSKDGKKPATKLTLKNINVYGILNGKDKAGGLVGDASASSIVLVFENCNNYANVTGDRAAGIVCCSQNATSSSFINCHNYGNITSTKTKYGTVAGITAMNTVNSTFTNCSNEKNELENKGILDGYIAYDLATYVFITFNTDGTYKAVTSGMLPAGILDCYHRFAGTAKTAVDWQWVEAHAHSTFDSTGLLAGIAYGVDETYDVITHETTDAGYDYSRKFATLNDALSHKLQNPVITLNSDQSLSYTFESGWTVGENEVALGSVTLDLGGHVMSTSSRLFKAQGSIIIQNGSVNFTGSGELGHFANSGNITFVNASLNAGLITVEHAAVDNCRINFDGDSHITCTIALNAANQVIKINGVEYSGANGNRVHIENNVITQTNS